MHQKAWPTDTDAWTDNPKPICPVNFFEVGGIITLSISLCLIPKIRSKPHLYTAFPVWIVPSGAFYTTGTWSVSCNYERQRYEALWCGSQFPSLAKWVGHSMTLSDYFSLLVEPDQVLPASEDKEHRKRLGGHLMIIKGKFSTVLHKNMCCGYSLESPQQGDSNEYQQHMCKAILKSTNKCFYEEIWKKFLKITKITRLIWFSERDIIKLSRLLKY